MNGRSSHGLQSMDASGIPRLLCASTQQPPRVLLRPHEAAHVLQVSVREVRNRLRRRSRVPRLTAIRSGSRVLISADELAEQVGGDRLALEILVAIVDGRCVVPRPPSEMDAPTSLISCVGVL
jgi:hypothetical protein